MTAMGHVTVLFMSDFDIQKFTYYTVLTFLQSHIYTVSQAYFALHNTLHKVQNFQEKNIFCY
jgi:hypothetical protein